MVFPENFDEKTGFAKIRQMLVERCMGYSGKKIAEAISFSSDIRLIRKQLDQTYEFLTLLQENRGFPFGEYDDIISEIKGLQTIGTYLDEERLFALLSILVMARECGTAIAARGAKYPELLQLWREVTLDLGLIRETSRIIDEKGKVKDNASAALKQIRVELLSTKNTIEKRIHHHLKAARQEGWISQDTVLAVRAGRLVIPVPSAYKRQIRGFVLDESATGQTVYIEPEEVFEANNRIRELENSEKREIIKILKDFAHATLRPILGELITLLHFIAQLDCTRAKALLAQKTRSTRPHLTDKPVIAWKEAIHPLLFLTFEKQNKRVVSNDIELNESKRIMVISGPNAGGKSVCLKTAGLLQYMLQCGLLIPVAENSTAGIFNKLFIDIGDEQSLENDLSTYSSHLLHFSYFMKNADNTTLFLIDEFGAGTDPQPGGALAEAVLEELNAKEAFGIVTTHYSNLKLLAKEGNGIVNAAMLFDTDKMEPLFVLTTGKPGSSFTFEIAKKTDFPATVLARAQEKTGRKQLDFEEQLQQLETEKNELGKKLREFSVADEFLNEMVEKYKHLLDDLNSKKKTIIEEARNEALQLITESNRLIENTIREIREAQAEKEKTRAIRKKVEEQKGLLEKQITDQEKKKKKNKKEEVAIQPTPHRDREKPVRIKAGDTVSISDQDAEGTVVKINGQDVWIAFGSVILKTTLDKCIRVSSGKKNPKPALSGTSFSGILADRLASFGLSIDVRGKRGDEAVDEVKKYIESAIMLKMPEVRIIHGKGYGILRTLVHDFLKTVFEVNDFGDEHIERGGHGVTVVRIGQRSKNDESHENKQVT